MAFHILYLEGVKRCTVFKTWHEESVYDDDIQVYIFFLLYISFS